MQVQRPETLSPGRGCRPVRVRVAPEAGSIIHGRPGLGTVMRTLLAVALFACCLAVGRASTLKAWSGVALSGDVPAPLYRPKHFAFALTCLVGMSFAGRAHSAYSCPNYDDSVSACRDAAARGGCGGAHCEDVSHLGGTRCAVLRRADGRRLGSHAARGQLQRSQVGACCGAC